MFQSVMIFKKYKNKQGWERFLVISLSVLFLDQIIKLVITKSIFFEVDVYKNANALFGISLDPKLILVLYIFFFAVLFRERKKILLLNDKIASVSLGLMCGGIISNFIDRMVCGYILDYINIPNFFSFSIADVAIFLGAFVLSYEILRK